MVQGILSPVWVRLHLHPWLMSERYASVQGGQSMRCSRHCRSKDAHLCTGLDERLFGMQSQAQVHGCDDAWPLKPERCQTLYQLAVQDGT